MPERGLSDYVSNHTLFSTFLKSELAGMLEKKG